MTSSLPSSRPPFGCASRAALVIGVVMASGLPSQDRAAAEPAVVPAGALARWCGACHTGPDAEGGFELSSLLPEPVPDPGTEPVGAAAAKVDDERFERLLGAASRVRGRTMPPPDDDELPGYGERVSILAALAELAPRRPGARVATMRRLTRRQYEHTVGALFGIRWRARDLLPEDATAHGFEGIGDVQNVSPLMFEKYLDAADHVAAAVLADEGASARLFGSAVEGGWLPAFLARAYRRPVDAAEVEALVVDLARAMARGASREAARHAVLRSVLASPSFLFRAEVGRADDTAWLAPHEIAVRLAYMITSGPPDAELLAAVASGALEDAAGVREQALRLARQRHGRGLADDFASQWLQLHEVLTHNADFRRFPQIWNRSLRPALKDEVVRLFAHVVAADRSVLELLDSDYAFLDPLLARHYGLPPLEGRGFRRVDLDDRRRGGVLGAGAMLMSTSYPLRTSPVKRGQWVLARLLDSPPPPPPPEAGELPKDDKNKSGLTLREQLERHRQQRSCRACHVEMDALGFALENYDPLGRWRDEVHGKPVDASAELPDGTVIDGPIALKDALLLRADDFVRALAKNLLVHGIGRELTLADEAELAKIVAAARAHENRFSVLLAAVVTSPLFLMRDPDQQAAATSTAVRGRER